MISIRYREFVAACFLITSGASCGPSARCIKATAEEREPAKSAEMEQLAKQHAAPPPPSVDEVLDAENTRGVDLAKGGRFNPALHAQMVRTNRAIKHCTDILARSQWRQDILHFFDSTAHFDNCEFTASLTYLKKLLVDAECAAREHRTDDALAYLGRALHGIQDFYSHTNYVEMAVDQYTNPVDVPLVPLWKDNAEQILAELQRTGLYSGQVSWEPRNSCPSSVPSHHDLNKDNPKAVRGSQPIAKWNMTHHDAAAKVAQRATEELIFNYFSKATWAEVARDCNAKILYPVFTDNRKHD